jgi:hypothetical protein
MRYWLQDEDNLVQPQLGSKGGCVLMLMPTKLVIPNLTLLQAQLQGHYILAAASDSQGLTLIMFVMVPADTSPNELRNKNETVLHIFSKNRARHSATKWSAFTRSNQEAWIFFFQKAKMVSKDAFGQFFKNLGRTSYGRDHNLRIHTPRWLNTTSLPC